MKSIFKRVLASATGSVMLLSQMAATAVGTTAADAPVLNKDLLTDVPVPGEAPALDTLPIVIEGEASEGELTAVEFGVSNWNDKFDTAIKALVGDSDSVLGTVNISAAKNAIKTALKKSGRISDANIEKIIAGIGEGELALEDGYATVTVKLSNIGEALGDAFVEYLKKNGGNFTRPDGVEVEIDWTDYVVEGTAKIAVDFSKYDKTATYDISFNDGKKDYKSVDEFEAFATAKFTEAMQVIVTEGAKQGLDVSGDMAKYAKSFAKLGSGVKKTIAAIGKINYESTDPEEAYSTYIQEVSDKMDESGAKRATSIVKSYLAKLPSTLASLIESKGSVVDTVFTSLQAIAGDKAVIDISASDFADLLSEGSNWQIAVEKGSTATASFELEDDKNQKVFDLINAAYADQWADEGYELVSVDTSKLVEAAFVGAVQNGFAGYDVTRYIDKVTLKKVETTTTSTEESETTTTSTEESEPASDTTTSTEESEQVSDTTTSTEESEQVSDTTTSTEASEEPGSETSSDEESATTTTTTIVSIEFVPSGVDTDLVYWSEEETVFDLANLSIAMKIYEAGNLVKTYDVTKAFTSVQKDATDFEFTGYGRYGIQFVLLDEAAIQKNIEDAGYNGTDVLAYEKKAGSLKDKDTTNKYYVGAMIPVILVLRGDFNLDNKIDPKDATLCQKWYNSIVLNDETVDFILENDNNFKTNLGNVTALKHGHYAADVRYADGLIDPKDATLIQKWYNYDLNDETETFDQLAGTKYVPLSGLHANPFAYETISK